MAGKLTDAKIAGAVAGRELLESLGRGLGSLSVRVTPSRRRVFYFRFKPPGGNQQRIELGIYSTEGAGDTLSLSKARRMAMQFATRYREHPDLRAHLEAERRNREVAERHRQDEEARKAAEASRGTLRALLEAYAAHLTAHGKRSGTDALAMFRRHVFEPWPAYADMRAGDLKPRDVTAILRTATEAGKGRTAGKLRSYIRAAYALALRAESDPTVPAAFVAFGIESNPAAVTAALSQYNRARDRTLTAGELGFYLRALEAAPPSEARDTLLLALLLGGQRPAQLLRATRADVDLHARTIRLLDPKGKRAQPRVHVLPLTDDAAAIVARRLELATVHVSRRERQQAKKEGRELPPPQESPWLFSASGKQPTRPETLCVAVRKLAAAAVADKALQKARATLGMFELRDVRRTCETMLAGLGVSRDVRAQIQSHGLGGIQQRHYDRHDYMREKAAALEQWGAYLRGLRDERVTPMAGRPARPAKQLQAL
jgi:integrase